MAAMSSLLSLSLLLLLITGTTVSSDQMESLNIEVDIGRRLAINPEERVFKDWANKPGTMCKVEVVANEPMTQRVGLWEPKIFDCDFKLHVVRYVHFGSPLVDQDNVKLRIYRMTVNDTEELTVQVVVKINLTPYNIAIVRNNIVVREPFGVSQAVTEDILGFMPQFLTSDTCYVEFFPYLEPRLPARGVIVQGAGSSSNPIVDGIKRSCQEFQNLGLRYKHVEGSSNVDFIPLLVVASRQDFNKGVPWKEWVQLQVVIEKAAPNTPPRLSPGSTLHMTADQYVLTAIAPSVLAAEDAETPWSDLVFEISQPLSSRQGDIVHLDYSSRSASSFAQYDVNNARIAYRPPREPQDARTTISFGVTIWDQEWERSAEIFVNISLRSTFTKAPRIFTGKSITLLKGQSRVIRENNLKIVDSDNLSSVYNNAKNTVYPKRFNCGSGCFNKISIVLVRAIITAGPTRGTLRVNGSASLSFTPMDISKGLVTYNHDGSFGTTDSILLRVTDNHHESSVQMTINILPKDDSAPILLVNVGLQVLEAGVVQISPQSLVALDEGTSADRVYFIVLRPPLIGEIQKRLPWQRYGVRIWNFTQDDVNQGLIYYSHNGQEVFFDVFDICLKDSEPQPNQSPIYTVMVTVVPIDDSLPRLLPISTLSLTVKETEIAYFTKDIVSYADEDSKELTYVLQTPPRKIGSRETKSDGRIVSVDGRFEPTKDTDLPEVVTFTQKQIDHFQIVYVPPENDIGTDITRVEFTFTVTDEHGNSAPPQNFQITVIPVNDKAPLLMASTLSCREGETSVLTATDFSLNDVDTDIEDIEIQLTRVPSFGHIAKGNRTMLKGEKFKWDDIEKENLKYVHNDANENYDVFILLAWDGKQGVPTNVDVRIKLNEDEISIVEKVDSSTLTVLEGGEVVISREVLSASGLGTEEDDIVFSVVQFPHEGELLIAEQRASSFTEADVVKGKVKYRHSGRELGTALATDGMRFEITDSTRRKASYGRSYVTINVPTTFFLNVTILPTDNSPPKIKVVGTVDVAEGEFAVLSGYLIVTTDSISRSIDDMKIILRTEPTWGYIENLTPLPGSEELRSHISVTEWSVRDCNEGYVRYVQAKHKFVEPRQDTFTVYVTNGFLNSTEATITVSIKPRNDERPKVTVQNFTIREADTMVLDGNILHVEDLDIPEDNLTLALLRPPNHGAIVQLLGRRGYYSRPGEITFSTMNWKDFDQNLVYKHDGSEHRTDTFSLLVHDGEHLVDCDIHVAIYPVNDQKPTLTRNLGLDNVQPNSIATISQDVLRAEDPDTPNSEIHFQVHVVPLKGELQKRTSTSSIWSLIESGTTFTQEEVNLNLVRYFHWGLENGTGKDYFRFTVTDLIYETGQILELFEIRIIAELDQVSGHYSDLNVKIRKIAVPVGSSIALNQIILSANDGLNKSDGIQFKIVSPPRQGLLQISNQSNQPEHTFTMLDVLQERVIYKNTKLESSPEDSFQLSVSNGISTKNITLHIDLISLEQFHSQTITKADTIMVPEDGWTIIDLKTLNSSSNNFMYVVTQHPYHGYLSLDGQRIEEHGSSFSPDDVQNQKLTYVRYHTRGFTPDLFKLKISNAFGEFPSYLVNGNLIQGSMQFSVTVIPRKQTETSFEFPVYLENFGRGKQGFVILPKNTATHGRSEPEVSMSYRIIQTPAHGFIENINSYKVMIGDNQFSTDDLHRKNIRYVINTHGTEATEDSFQLQVQEDGKFLRNESINLEWSAIFFTDSQFLVCEDAAQVVVMLQRTGKKSDSSYVSLQAISSSAREYSDFITGKHPQIQFDPGQSTATKTIQIVTDNLEESEREIFYIRLHDPVNAVVGKNSKAVVTIVDSKKGICSRSNSLPATITTTERPFDTFTVRTSLTVFQTANDTTNTRHTISSTISPNMAIPNCGRATEGLLHKNPNNTLSRCKNGSWHLWENLPSTTWAPSSTPTTKNIPTSPTSNSGEYPVRPTQNEEAGESICDHGWEVYEGACYSWFSRRLARNAASSFCETRFGANLTIVKNSHHNRWLSDLTDGATFWIGLVADETAPAGWIFPNGDSKFTNWKRGFPKMKGRRGKSHKCAAATPPRVQWVNKSCTDDVHSFICFKYY